MEREPFSGTIYEQDSWGYRSGILAEKAQDLLGTQCSQFVCISSGSNHKIYRMTMHDGRSLIGRILSPCFKEYGAGACPEDSMESEIDVMRYVKIHTSIPVPEVYLHDQDKKGQVGGEWMILEDVPGTNLMTTWAELTFEQRCKVALAIVDVWTQLMRLRFEAIGSIRSREDDKNSFYVGPMTFMPTNVGSTTGPPEPSKCGPFSCARDWLLALARHDMRFPREIPLTDTEKSRMADVITDIEAAPFSYLDDQSSNLSPWTTNVLLHIDLDLHNIMVDHDDPTIITGVIDWEGACVVPLWSILPFFLSRIRCDTPECDLEKLDEIRSLMKCTLLGAVPEWANLVAGGREARMLRLRAALSEAAPEGVVLIDDVSYG